MPFLDFLSSFYFYFLENTVPNFLPFRCFIFLQFFFVISFSDLSNQRMENVVDVLSVSRARLVERAAKFCCKCLSFLGLYHPLGLLEVNLVGHQDHRHILRGPHLGDQGAVLYSLIEAVSVSDAVADDEALPTTHVLFPHGGEL